MAYGNQPLITLSRKIQKEPKDTGFKAWRKSWKKKATSEKSVLIIMFFVFLIYGFTLVFPLIWAFYNSFKAPVVYNEDAIGLPGTWIIQNYIDAFTMISLPNKTSILGSIFNSLWMSTLSTVLGLVASCLTSYVCAKYKFKGSGVIYAVAIVSQIIPLVGSTTGMYNLLWNETFQLADNPLTIWPIWFGGFGFSFLMLYGAFKSVPWSYAESAFIDGAGHFKTFLHVMLPAVKPVLASLFVVNFISAWNDYMTAYLYMPSYSPLAYAVYYLQRQATDLGYPVYLAVICLSVLPTIILFICFQKTIMENTTTGGLKG